jgi:predicted ATPase/DNA-binding winged helix-turn-helix (wHTH) protein
MPDQIFTFGPFKLIPSQRLLLESDRPLHVGNRALTILQILTERAGEVVEKRELARLVWPSTFVDEANIRVHIAALRRALGDGQNGVRYIVNEPGRGYTFTAPVSRFEEATPPPRGGIRKSQQSSALPNFIVRLVGREDSVAKLRGELMRERMVTIVGPGGIGKTSLALATAPSWVSHFGSDVYFADLATSDNPNGVSTAVASAISIKTTRENVVETIIHDFRDRRALIILDNCEHLVNDAASFCEALLIGSKNIHLLATSREALRIPGERIHRLASLPVPAENQTMTATEALAFPSVQLFVERAIANVDTFELQDADVPAVANICRRLDGIPLAIEFAAARVDLMDVRTIAKGLDDRFVLLSKGHRNALPRHQTLRSVIEWSYSLLSTDRKAVLRRLSVFASNFGVDDAVDVVAGNGVLRQRVFECLSDLVAKSLLLADVSGQAVLYRLLETTHVYAYEELSAAGEVGETRRRHARRILEVCETSICTEEEEWSRRRAIPDVRAALDWAFAFGGDVTLGVRLAVAATPSFFKLSLLREHKKYLEMALEQISAIADQGHGNEQALRAEMILRIAAAQAEYFTVGHRIEVYLERAREIAQQLGDKAEELKVLWILYGQAGNFGSYRQSLYYAQSFSHVVDSSATSADAVRGKRILARALGDLGDYAVAQQNIELALRPGRLAMLRITNGYEIDDWIAARAILARLLWLRGYPDDAKNEAEQCISDSLQLGHDQSTCWAFAYCLCPIAIWRGDVSSLERLVGLLLQHSRKVFNHYHEWGLLYRQFLTRSLLAPASADESSEIRFIPTSPAQADMFATFGNGLTEPRVLARVREDEDIWCAPEVLRTWACDLIIGGREPELANAESALVRSFEIARRQGAKAWELRTATTLASFYRASGRVHEAGAVLDAALKHFSQGIETRDVQAAMKVLSELSASTLTRDEATGLVSSRAV